MHTVIAQGVEVPALGLGTWLIEGTVCRGAVRHALEIGYRHIDTAQVYGNEDEVGLGIEDSGVSREDVFLVTKLSRRNVAPERVAASTEQSLARLRTDYVDLLLVHWPSDEVPVAATLEVMLALVDEGKVGHLGLSNFSPRGMREAARHAPVLCNQVEYHPFLSQAAVLHAAEQLDMVVTAYAPVARGRVARDPVLRQIAEAHGKTAFQVALRWLVEQDRVAAVPKAADPEHRVANLDIFDFALTDEERKRIDDLARGERLVAPAWSPDWDEE